MKFWHKVFLFAYLLTSTMTLIEAQPAPKREFHGAWVATVTNIDWPTSPGAAPSFQRSQLTPGRYSARFDGHNLSSGIYFYRLVASGLVGTKKMQLVK